MKPEDKQVFEFNMYLNTMGLLIDIKYLLNGMARFGRGLGESDDFLPDCRKIVKDLAIKYGMLPDEG
jgi:hypothetical protein